MVTAVISKNNFFFFNVSAHVGAGRANHLDDVELVRFGYLAARESKNPSGVDFRADMAAVLVNLKPSGPFGPDLDATIRHHLIVRGGIQDGCISPITNSSINYRVNIWVIAELGLKIQQFMPENFPRLDKHPQCGPALRSACLKFFGD